MTAHPAKNVPLSPEAIQKRFDEAKGQIGLQAFRLVSTDPAKGELTVIAPIRPEFHRGAEEGRWHGGALASIVDSIAVFALVATTGSGAPTVNIRVDYLKPAVGDLTVTGRVRRVGKSVAVTDVEVLDQAGGLVALGRATLSTVTG